MAAAQALFSTTPALCSWQVCIAGVWQDAGRLILPLDGGLDQVAFWSLPRSRDSRIRCFENVRETGMESTASMCQSEKPASSCFMAKEVYGEELYSFMLLVRKHLQHFCNTCLFRIIQAEQVESSQAQR